MDLLNYEDEDDEEEDELSTKPCMTTTDNNDNKSTPLAVFVSNNQHVPMTRKRPRGSLTIESSEEVPPNLFDRIIPHRRGHWSGHVHVPISHSPTNRITSNNSSTSSSSPTNKAIQHSIQEFYQLLQNHGFTTGTIVQHSHYHLSLSKYFSLQLAFIDSFVQKLTQRLATEPMTRVFIVQQQHRRRQPAGCILVNEDKTRSFWCWKVQSNSILLRILHHVDSCLKEYGQRTYYQPPHFHISIASFDGDLTSLVPLVESMGQDPPKIDSTTSPPDDHDETEDGDDDDSDGDGDEQEEENSSDNDNDDNDGTNSPLDSNLIKVDRLICKFGTTKTYSIPLARA